MSAERKPVGYHERGVLVEAWHDDGCGGGYVYGEVIAAGKQCFRVRWESGLTQRFRQGVHLVTPASDQAAAAAAVRGGAK